MKIRVLRNLGKGLPDYKENEEVDVADSEAEMLTKRGLAEIVESPKPKKASAEKAESKAAPPSEPKPKNTPAPKPPVATT